jgi:prefoldin subunit 5
MNLDERLEEQRKKLAGIEQELTRVQQVQDQLRTMWCKTTGAIEELLYLKNQKEGEETPIAAT